ncbi:hypothetical protein DDE18_14375 [Nocardioides gansuensis]|uniref:Uncharacterized protein n=1 Tax=Nocardioides gansuensis TaxID=2138300 RepID=A0A2T8F857_9ACTN|nr:hypothetical protein DDE18_14375 [Nocardioides gansuensis]
MVRVSLLLLMVVGIAVVLLLRPDGTGSPSSEPSPSSSSPTPTETVSPPTARRPPGERAFCAGFVSLADAQARYADDPAAQGAALEEAADRMVGLGVPESMPPAAGGGYYTLLNGIYSSLGKALDPAAVPGALPGEQLPDSGAAFSAYLAQACPA